jgi:transposase
VKAVDALTLPKKSKKFKQTFSARKLMATVFWDRRGVLKVEFMQQGTIMMSEVYSETQKMHRAIQNKKRGMPTCGVLVMLLCDRARPHTAAGIRVLLEHFSWKLFGHPPYSSDLAPSDYHLFTYLTNLLASQRFNNNEEPMEGVKIWLSPQAAGFSDTDTLKLIPRYRCVNSAADYVEVA